MTREEKLEIIINTTMKNAYMGRNTTYTDLRKALKWDEGAELSLGHYLNDAANLHLERTGDYSLLARVVQKASGKPTGYAKWLKEKM